MTLYSQRISAAFGRQEINLENLIDLILLFFSYSFLGWCIEVTLKLIQFHRFINRGFFTGPICPIYGSGAALITLIVGDLSPYESAYIQ